MLRQIDIHTLYILHIRYVQSCPYYILKKSRTRTVCTKAMYISDEVYQKAGSMQNTTEICLSLYKQICINYYYNLKFRTILFSTKKKWY